LPHFGLRFGQPTASLAANVGDANQFRSRLR
jgi:hypothetical protein